MQWLTKQKAQDEEADIIIPETPLVREINETKRETPQMRYGVNRPRYHRAPNMSLNISPDQEQANFELYCA